MKKLSVLIISVMIFPMLFGCYDKVEIDKRAFVSTIGLDTFEFIDKKEELKNINPDAPFAMKQLEKIKVTLGFPNISETGEKESGDAPNNTMVAEAPSFEDAIIKIGNKSSRTVTFGTGKLMVISEDFFRYPDTLKEVLDNIRRSPNINRVMYVITCEGQAEDILKFMPPMENNVENYLLGLMENVGVNSYIKPVRLNDMLSLMSKECDIAIPKVSIKKESNEVVLKGASIVKDFSITGSLSEVESSDIELLRGNLKGGKKIIYMEGHPVDYYITEVTRKLKVKEDDGKLNFQVLLQLDGELQGYIPDKKALDNADIEEIQNHFDNSLAKEGRMVLEGVQSQYGADLLELKEYLKGYHPFIWNDVKDNWSDTFKNSKIEVYVKTNIRRIGVGY